MLSKIFSIFKQFILLVLILKKFVKGIEYPATFDKCPGNYSRINNGCYFFVNASSFDWKTANEHCIYNHSAPDAITHLIAFESQAETISLSFWFKGYKYTNDFWTDGYMNSENKRIWSWSNQDYTTFGYVKDSGLTGNKYAYLKSNDTSTFSYEMRDDVGSKQMSYICEAQLTCSASENKCLNNGDCFINSGRVLCKCKDGYEGSLCEIQIDNCDKVPCLHGASCTNLVNNYTCSCTEFYYGRNCDIEIPYKYQTGRITALSVAVSIVGLILFILCLMDLPWNGFINRFFPTKEQKEKQMSIKANKTEVQKIKDENKLNEMNKEYKQHDIPTKEQMLASEEELIKKFKLYLTQNNTKKASRIQPDLVDYDPNDLGNDK